MTSVIEYVLDRLHEIGVSEVFGVPGDYSFGVADAISDHRSIDWVGCSNELNAAYAADGYARIVGVAAISTTFGVGELSAINGIAGAYAEHLPVFHLVGVPDTATQRRRALMHHTLGEGTYDVYRRMAEPVVCAQAVITPANVIVETERIIAAALYEQRPVYMAFPADLVNREVQLAKIYLPPVSSDRATLRAAVDAVLESLNVSSAVALPGIAAGRGRTRDALEAFIEASGLPFATTFMAKSVLDEQHPSYIGMYAGSLINEQVRSFVETRDAIINIASPFTDFNSGAFTADLDPTKVVTIGRHRTAVGGVEYVGVEMVDLLWELSRAVSRREWPSISPESAPPVLVSDHNAITAEVLYSRWTDFLEPEDIIVAETGTISMGLAFSRLPTGASFHTQSLWGSIGWATPAAFGMAVAAPERRVLLFTGDGSHQLTAQEISQFERRGLRPIVFVLNNGGFLIERLLCNSPTREYNDIAEWNYSLLPAALGCDRWFAVRVTTCAELDDALAFAATANGAYIEAVTETYAAPPLAEHLGVSLKALRAS